MTKALKSIFHVFLVFLIVAAAYLGISMTLTHIIDPLKVQIAFAIIMGILATKWSK